MIYVLLLTLQNLLLFWSLIDIVFPNYILTYNVIEFSQFQSINVYRYMYCCNDTAFSHFAHFISTKNPEHFKHSDFGHSISVIEPIVTWESQDCFPSKTVNQITDCSNWNLIPLNVSKKWIFRKLTILRPDLYIVRNTPDTPSWRI